MLRRVMTGLIDVVYPPLCAGCHRRGVWLCAWCQTSVAPLQEPVCDRCGAPCALDWCQCASLGAHLDEVRSALPYRGWVAEGIRAFKYQDETARAASLAEWMVPWLHTFSNIDALAPVPLHASRRRQRGYNQAELLARDLSRQVGAPLLSLIERTRATPPQVDLKADDRAANVAGAFTISTKFSPRSGGRFLLIDNVRTTGATLGACAAALRAADPRWVGALTVAWSMPAHVEAQWQRLRAAPQAQPAI